MQKDRYKEHKKVIKFMRELNKNISNDEYLGLNRFKIDMYREDWFRYEDLSGGYLSIIFKITDTLTGNYGMFLSNNYNYDHNLLRYSNDFLIRCSSGNYGHFPALSYIAYNVNTIIPYKGDNNRKTEQKAIGSWNLI